MVKCPQVLINLDNTAESGYEFDNYFEWPSRIWLNGKCDDIVRQICEYCGWIDDLNERIMKNCTKNEEEKATMIKFHESEKAKMAQTMAELEKEFEEQAKIEAERKAKAEEKAR